MFQALYQSTLSLSVYRPSWLFAQTFCVLGTVAVFIYRSPMVKDTDEVFAPVADLMSKCRLELVRYRVHEDAKMIFGQGELSLYLIHATSIVTPINVDPALVEELKVAEVEILKELTGAA